ncbi:MAG: hypothetical protein HZA90_14070 [Verrucomicrobia bacterium]|nr:hypothetical protein [Verrucomicrobiota bacterium]
MEIKLNTNHDLIIRAVQRPAASQPVSPVRDRAAFENLQTLSQELDQIPVVRPEKVARAQALVANTDWPPERTIEGLSNLLAMHMGQNV